MKDDDFGFSLVSEDELRQHEKVLEQKLVFQEKTSKEKMDGLVALFMPLLNNLSRDPDKELIKWPNRVEKIEAFKKKVAKYIEDNK